MRKSWSIPLDKKHNGQATGNGANGECNRTSSTIKHQPLLKKNVSINILNSSSLFQDIIHCLCKSYAILIPSLHDINHLCTILGNYLKSSHLFIRVATLRGLLVLLESCIKSNTTIGGLSEEILLLRTFISNYITRHGITDERCCFFFFCKESEINCFVSLNISAHYHIALSTPYSFGRSIFT